MFVLVVVLAMVVPRAWGQFLSDEERKGMFTVSLAYSMRDYDLAFTGASVPITELDEVLEQFAVGEELDSLELTVAWVSFGYVELRATVGLADYELTQTHSTDSGFDTVLSSSDSLIYGLSAIMRYPLTDQLLLAVELAFLTGNFDDVEGDVSQLDVVPTLVSTLDDIDWRELSVTPMVQYRLGNFLPYAGARFTSVETEVNTTQEITFSGETFERVLNYETADDLSAVVGLTWRITPLVMADFQAQLFNNERFTVGVKLTF
jgi:hypothetical protein